MLHILFVILKILAIILASILGLLLFLLLIVLFVPIRYRAELRKNDELIVKARVNWLLRIVFARVWFINKQLHLKLRVFGICIYDNLRPKKEKKPKKSSPDLKEKRFKRKEKKQKDTTSPKSSKKADNNESLRVDQKVIVKKSETNVEDNKTQVGEISTVIKETKTQVEETSTVVKDSITRVERIKTQDSETTLIDVTKIDIEVNHKSEDNLDKEKEENEQTFTKPKRNTIFSKIKAFFGKIKSILRKFFGLGGKIKSILSSVKTKFKNLSDLIKGLWEKKNKITAFLKNEINKAGIKVAFHQVLKVLKHCAPKKITGYVHYGTGDPCSTGETFAAAAFFYGKYGNSLKLVPDFEEEVLEAEVMVKGRIRIFSLLIIGIKLIRDKNFKKLLKNAKQLKEEL